MDIKIVELATQLTDKAMGGQAAAGSWIGQEEQVSKFLTGIATTLDELYMRPTKRRD